MFIWTISDIIGLAVFTVVIAAIGLYAIAHWLHNRSVRARNAARKSQ
jgi:hypothetical protein